MSHDNKNEENNKQTQSPGEIIEKHKHSNNVYHNSNNPNSLNAGFSRASQRKQESSLKNLNTGISTNNQEADVDLDDSNMDADFETDFNGPTPVEGAVAVSKLAKNWKLIAIILGAVGLFFIMFLVIFIFLSKYAEGLNYASGSYLDSEEYRKIYDEVESVVTEYRRKYGITVDKYLIISALTAYQGNEMYSDNTESSAYDEVIVEDETTGVFDKSDSEMKSYAEILAKYQIKTTTSCSYDSSTIRKIASNDDSGFFDFLKSAAAKEKNYDCSGSSNAKNYSLSTDMGDIDDDNSGSTFYWNLIDEDFLKEYYSEYFEGLSGDVYEQTAADVVEYIYMYAVTLKTYDTTNTTVTACNGTSFWWPIGSEATTTNNGKTLASGEPVLTYITATFAGNDATHRGAHGALDIANSGDINVIASKAGTVIYPTDTSQTQYANTANSSDGGGYGNYVIIEHSDGTYTLYAHMRPNSITVLAGDDVAQGQVIGMMGNSGNSTGQHLHFEIRVGGSSSSNKVDPEDYVSMDDPRPGCGDFSLTSTSLTKQEFVTLMNNYCTSTQNTAFCENFAAHAEEVYTISLNNNVNPELVVVTAGTEQAFKKTCGYNFWGIGIGNGQGCSDGAQYSTLEEGIRGYASTISNYLEGGSSASFITQRYNERENAGCDPSGHGLPGTLAGMQSVYSWIGNHRYNPGNSGKGGCYYLNIIYGSGYCSSVATCTNYDSCSEASKTTVCEQNDYTAWQLKEKVELRNSIFGL